MDLESESSVLESVEDNEVIVSECLRNVSENTLIDSNGACNVHIGNTSLTEVKSEGIQSSPSGSIGSTPQVKKGYVLKKWKRIRRESSKEQGNAVDNGKVGKRGLSNATPNSRIPVLSAETKQKSEGSVSSTNAVVKIPGLVADGFDSGLVVGPIYATAADSENSEDWSSKSSTAASAPRQRSDIAVLGGYIGDNNGFTSSNRDHNLAVQRGQQGKSRTDSGKKPRGDQVKIEKENSHSSMESDSQGSNFVFMQGASSVTSKGRQSRRSANYDGENSDDEAQGSGQRFAEELQAGFRKNMAEFEDVSQSYVAADLNWENKGENSENIGLSADQDPLLESITTLQYAQEALAQELQNFREIGKDDSFLFSDVVQDSSPNLSEQQQYGETGQTSQSSCENEIVNLKRNVDELESKLANARSMLEVKEGKVIELENSLNSNASRQEENREITELETRSSRELETELEGLFQQKIEAEVEYLVISRNVQHLRVTAVDKITCLDEQRTLATEQAQILNLSENVGNKANMLKRRADKLYSLIFIMFVVFCLFVLQSVPQYTEDVPT